MNQLKAEQPEDYAVLLKYIKQLAQTLEGIRYIYLTADTFTKNIEQRKQLNQQGTIWYVDSKEIANNIDLLFDVQLEKWGQSMSDKLLEELNIPKNTPLDAIVEILETKETERT